MFRTPTLTAGLLAATIAVVGIVPSVAQAQDADHEAVEDVLEVESDDPSVDPPHRGLIVFSADARVDGHRVPDAVHLALGYNDRFPYWASLWLLVDEETDEWAPICIGYLIGDGDRAMFVGASTIGDDGDGCLIVPLGDEDDDGNVAFGVVELEGDSVATAAMYAIG